MDPTQTLACWRLRLSNYSIDLFHCVGITHQRAGALSGLTTAGANLTLMEDGVVVLCINISILPEKGKAKVVYIQEHDVTNDERRHWNLCCTRYCDNNKY